MAAAATEAANLKDFFEDNKKRYKAKSTEEGRQRMQPTPILPILVSDRMKAYLRERYLSIVIPSTTTTSLPISSQSAPSLHPSFASLQTKDYKHPDIQLDQQTYDEAEKLEQSQDRRAQENLLQQNQVQEQSDKETDISNDPMLVAEYADEIFKYLRSTEKTMLADPSYITIQHEVTWRMRAVLIDWVIEIHYIFQLLPETLFLAVNIIDRFLSRRDVSLSKLQLVGIASLFVATKFEETTSPPIKQYLFMTGDAVSEEDLLRSERYILQILDFKLCYPNPLHFLRRSTMTGNFDLHIRLLAKYFMEITLIDHRFLDTPPSQTAAASLWLATKMLCKGSWTPELAKASGYTPLEIKPTVELMLEYLSQPVTDDSFFKKWSSRRMMKVSIFVRDWVQRFYTDS
ncbi:cyclin-like protein [Halteromyces radiatus]|uniref:cyclin-like protein n=1 Tax=Halteromyces radiatus TaxID=101107 RepID=UPI00221E996C|nr:cyclin-like protein [Halteromyces radiatus]KAI8076870.1 cyclin-like protein [Halteromyces radiatus]